MRMLFVMDKKDYADCTHEFVRNSAGSIIIRDGRVAMFEREARVLEMLMEEGFF
ncbi:MAG: hypothetical protein K6G60_07390 [Lachnospiraceae bacterium]|nr:hypothetical protein [Lachnospiraceae bacterium]